MKRGLPKRFVQNLSLAGLSLLFTLLIVEGLTRVLLPKIGWRLFEDRELGWVSREYRQFDPTADELERSTTRILVLGDSYLAGSGVSRLNQRFPVVLDQMLGERAAVQILAARGWGTDQELLAFMGKGRHWEPDIVVVAFVADNDISNNLSNSHGPDLHKPYYAFDEAGELQLHDFRGNRIEPPPYPSESSIEVHSYAFDLLRYVQLRHAARRSGQSDQRGTESVDPRYLLFLSQEERPDEIYRLEPELSWSPQMGNTHVSAFIHEDFELNAYQWELLAAILAELRDETEKTDARLVVMLLPVPYKAQDVRFVAGGELEYRFQTPDGAFTFRATEPRDRLARICDELGIELFDPTREFIDLITERDLVERSWPRPPDRHFSPVAHAILAEQLHTYLQDNP